MGRSRLPPKATDFRRVTFFSHTSPDPGEAPEKNRLPLTIPEFLQGDTTDDQEKLKALEREVRELRRTNEILRKASAYFAHKAWEADPSLRSARVQRDEFLKVEIRRVWDENFAVYGAVPSRRPRSQAVKRSGRWTWWTGTSGRAGPTNCGYRI